MMRECGMFGLMYHTGHCKMIHLLYVAIGLPVCPVCPKTIAQHIKTHACNFFSDLRLSRRQDIACGQLTDTIVVETKLLDCLRAYCGKAITTDEISRALPQGILSFLLCCTCTQFKKRTPNKGDDQCRICSTPAQIEPYHVF